MDKLNIHVSREQLNVLLTGLGELPAKVSIDLIIELQRQVREQTSTEESA